MLCLKGFGGLCLGLGPGQMDACGLAAHSHLVRDCRIFYGLCRPAALNGGNDACLGIQGSQKDTYTLLGE